MTERTDMSELIPIEYECDKVASIRRCASEDFVWGTAPAFWYIKRPMLAMHSNEIGMTSDQIERLKEDGFKVAYWNGDRWWHHTPKQFETAQEAFNEWKEKVRGSEQT